ncbi:MAG: serine/threonine protein kinase [Verrucomicrobia bacterium]|jgi:eukaryotic-like serine/threonine-protein kinase|nr:serine/threonine protein kinase [Verrucomicrobiota bacterium]
MSVQLQVQRINNLFSTVGGGSEFLRQRVRLLARMGLYAILFGLVVHLASSITTRPIALSRLSWHIAASVPLLLLLWFSKINLGTRTLLALETVFSFLTCTCLMIMGAGVSTRIPPEMLISLILQQFLFARAALLPSGPGHTAVMGLMLSVPMTAVTYLSHRHNAPVHYLSILGGQWISTVAVATALSHVIHGLRRSVGKARRLGQYTLGEQLGAGGMGEVYRADHALLQRPAALKLISNQDDESLKRFEREAQTTALLTHPNTITIFDYGRTVDGQFYYVMELLSGLSLQEAVARSGAFPEARIIHILKQAAGSLAEAHRYHMIHRDIKPGNLMICRLGGMLDVVKVLDFGLVKRLSTCDLDLTQEGTVLGTPTYLPPECINTPHSIDHRSDLYSLGAVGYYLLCGSHVFTGQTHLEICTKHATETPIAPSVRCGRTINRNLEDIIMACLKKDPDQRPQSMEDLLQALSGITGLEPWRMDDAEAWWRVHDDRHACTSVDSLETQTMNGPPEGQPPPADH